MSYQDPSQPPYGQQSSYGQQPDYGQPQYPTQPGQGAPQYPPSQPPYSQPPPQQQYPVSQPPQPAYGQAQYAPPVTPMPVQPVIYAQAAVMPVAVPSEPGSGQAVTGLVLGIIGLVFGALSWVTFGCTGTLGLILGVLGLIFGALGRKSLRRKGMATAGLVMGIIAVALSVGAWLVVGLAFVGAGAGAGAH